jgi:hypothetical protein
MLVDGNPSLDLRSVLIATLGRFDELQASGQLERLVRSGAREMLVERRHEVQRLLHYREQPEPALPGPCVRRPAGSSWSSCGSAVAGRW